MRANSIAAVLAALVGAAPTCESCDPAVVAEPDPDYPDFLRTRIVQQVGCPRAPREPPT